MILKVESLGYNCAHAIRLSWAERGGRGRGCQPTTHVPFGRIRRVVCATVSLDGHDRMETRETHQGQRVVSKKGKDHLSFDIRGIARQE